MILKNATVCNGNFEFEKTDIVFENGIITHIGKTQSEGTDCTGKVILPGFIDIHIHGCRKCDATDGNPGSVTGMSSFLAEHGITSFCPTTMTIPRDELEKSFGFVRDAMGGEPGAYIHGINMEGPFISPAKKGAQAEEHILNPDIEFFGKLADICKVCLVDIAPEMPGADLFIKEISRRCRVSLAHSAAGYETCMKAFGNGMSHATHLFNAMTQLNSREPGAVGAVFDSKTVTAELICDGIHISPATLRIAFSVLGKDRTVIISDSTMAAGLEEGEYTLGGQKVIKTDAVRLPDGTLAGSATNLFDEFRNVISYGIPLEQAVRSVTINPAKVIGADKTTGSISEGKYADLIVLDESLSSVENVIIKGRKVI